MSSEDECTSMEALISARMKQFANGTPKPDPTPRRWLNGTPTPVPASRAASKLSLKYRTQHKENLDPMKTPDTASTKKVSASFLFSSCKKKQMGPKDELPPGHTVLVGDSSEEELFEADPFENPSSYHNSEIVNESLVEYSLIRKWLQNSESPSSASDTDSKLSNESDEALEGRDIPSPIVTASKKSGPESFTHADDTVILSSDDGGSPIFAGTIVPRSPMADRRALLPDLVEAKIQESVLADDSFDASFTRKPSLRDRLETKREIPESEDDSDDSLPILKLPTRSRQLALSDSDDSDDQETRSSSVQVPPWKNKGTQGKNKGRCFQTLSDKASPLATDRKALELEELFVDLTVDDVPTVKPKKKVMPRERTPKVCRSKPLSDPPPSYRRASFLASLSVNFSPEDRRHPDALPYIKAFRKHRDELTQRLFALFNEQVFGNKLPRDFSITWNARLTRTAGYCRHFTRRVDSVTIFESKIELSVKVVDTACRLRDTLIHEMCHASTWMIDNCRGGHGPVWRKWANLALRSFPELPPISRCHNYEISFKFYYNCTVCKFSTGRHSKSVDTTTHVCPMCRGKLELSREPHRGGCVENKVDEATPKSAPKTPRTPNVFALFVKEHYASTKASRSDLPHAAIMKILSAKFAESKQSKTSG